jgi:beta-1,4-mannosyl-glycoprotein beta-1,4-N-acetylglucosaminyltransferase
MTNKIIDCFTFYNELEMLKFRLDYLYDTVDNFVLLESTLTFSGKQKELYFQNNKHLYEAYKDKIIHVVVEDLPLDDPSKNAIDNAWVREKLQRNLLDRGINQLQLTDNDIIVITDLDEIPDRNTLALLKTIDRIENVPYALEQDMYYYNITCKRKAKWYHPKFVNFITYKNEFRRRADDIRMVGRHAVVKNGGWHLSYFGNVDFIQNKIKNFAHQEYNDDKYTNSDIIKKRINNCSDLFSRDNEHNTEYCAVSDNQYLPETYKDLLKFSDLNKN